MNTYYGTVTVEYDKDGKKTSYTHETPYVAAESENEAKNRILEMLDEFWLDQKNYYGDKIKKISKYEIKKKHWYFK